MIVEGVVEHVQHVGARCLHPTNIRGAINGSQRYRRRRRVDAYASGNNPRSTLIDYAAVHSLNDRNIDGCMAGRSSKAIVLSVCLDDV